MDIFPGFPTFSILQEIQKDLEEKNIQPENFEDRIIFMSMFNDILWKSDDENCISTLRKSRITRRNSFQDFELFCVQGRKRDGMATLTIKKDSSIRTANKMVQHFKETGHPIFISTSALSRGILFQKRGRSTIHFNGV